MTYRNGIKEYAMSGFFYEAVMGLFFGLINQSLIAGIVGGGMCGGLFVLFIFLFCKGAEKKFDKKRAEIVRERAVFCDGGATLNGVGGWLFFTGRGLEFYPHKVNFNRKELFLPLESMKSARAKKNQILVETVSDGTIAIVVTHSGEWKKQIEVHLPSAV